MRSCFHSFNWFQHTAARRRLGLSHIYQRMTTSLVSTHSRPKAAGPKPHLSEDDYKPSFNTQPPEGGWIFGCSIGFPISCFNTQPPEGGWKRAVLVFAFTRVSTHSRPKAAGIAALAKWEPRIVSTHSRPKAAGRDGPSRFDRRHRFNTQPPEGGWIRLTSGTAQTLQFQHTAARRRLARYRPSSTAFYLRVSTHSRPKAAGDTHRAH